MSLITENPDIIAFQNVVVSNADDLTSSHELCTAAVHHLTEQGDTFLQMPHRSKLVNEFANPQLFPMICPTLFPYGIGGMEDNTQSVYLSLLYAGLVWTCHQI